MSQFRQYIFISFFILVSCSHRPASSVGPDAKETIPSESDEPNPDALKHFMDAQLYISQNNYPMAIIELQDALRFDPNAGSIHVSLAESLWKLGKIERAEEQLKTAISLNDKDVEARVMLANQYIIRHQYKKAEDQFIILSTIEPNNAEHVNAHAELAAAQMQWGKAIQLYRKAYTIDPSQIRSLERAAEIALRSNQLQIATEVYAQLVKIDSRNIEYLSAYADLAIMGKDYEKATEIINMILDVEGITKNRIFQSGVIFYQKGQFEQSLSFLRQAFELDQEDVDVMHYLTSALLELGQIDSANIFSEKMIALFPDDPRGYINKTLVYLNTNNFQNATEFLQSVADKFENEYAIQYLLGNSYYQNHTYDQALIYLNRALEILPTSRSVLHILAIINDSQNQWTVSDSLYEQLISTDSTDAQALNNYAYSLVERNSRLENALQYAAKAIALAPKNAAYLDTYGWIHFKLGHIDEALTYVNNAIELEDTNAVVLEHYGDILLSSNRKKEALEYYRKALEIDPENESLKLKAYSE